MRATEFLNEDLSTDELQQVEKFADALWKKKGIDVDFTKHFGDRVNDPRNGKPISAAELVRIFKKEYERNGKDIETMDDPDAILKDKSTKINVPFALNKMYDKKNMVATTIMRKDNFYGKPGQPEFVVNEEDLNEIERLRKDDYTGGKGELDIYKTPGEKKLVPLPGNRELSYSIKADRDGTRQFIFIVDPKYVEKTLSRRYGESAAAFISRVKEVHLTGSKPQPKIVAKLSIEAFNSPIPNAVQVGSITVDEDYRGRGLARSLYAIVLYIMKKTLVAGNEQTPGGRRNWVMLTNIPGVEVKGFVQLDTDDTEFNPTDWPDLPEYQRAMKQHEKQVDAIHTNIMKLGGQFIGKNKYSEYWAFDVMPGKGELAPAVKNSLSKLYSDRGDEPTGLYAKWVGS